MQENQFFAMLSRMKYINRWGLMRNVISENISEHSLFVAFIAHALGVIKNKRFGGNVNCDRLAVLAMYHDATEIITGDMPTPIKYYSKKINSAYEEVENVAKSTLLSYLPEDIREEYVGILEKRQDDEYLWKLVKAADRISALIKCIEEKEMGNKDFERAEQSILESIKKIDLPEVQCFMNEFISAFTLTLDEQV
jgi:5'-deoxynucleotidase